MSVRIGSVLRVLFLLRYQAAAAAFLVALPFVALRTPARAMLANLFAVTPLESVWISALAVLLAWVVMVTTQLTYRLAGEFDSDAPAVPRRVSRLLAAAYPYRVALFALLALPVIAALAGRSGSWEVAVGAAAGVVLAWLLFAAASLLYALLLPPRVPMSDLLLDLDASDRLHHRRVRLPAAAQRWVERLNRRFTPGHLLCLALFLCFVAVYVAAGVAFRPNGRWATAFPALGFGLLVTILATWLLTGTAFWLDHYRVPTLAALLAVSFAGYVLSATDHYYKVLPSPVRLSCGDPGLSPARMVQAWREALPPGARPRMAVVAASGGGIAASAWTATVLTGLEEDIGPRFSRSLALVSAVSGGSVGALYYLDRFTRAGGGGARRQAVRDAAAASSLRQAAWGIAYPDLWRFLFAPLLRLAPALDRAWATEFAWRAGMADPRATLRRWRAGVVSGALPVSIFNATVVETGRLMLLSPVDLGDRTFDPFVSFQCLYPDRDLDLVTAARLSASFPFISPIARPSDEVEGRYGSIRTEPGFHLADGGYHDSLGVTALVSWLDAVLPEYRRLGGREILLLEIRGYDTRPAQLARQRDSPERGWLYTLFGPLTTLLNVRATAQSVHGAEELRLLRALWEDRGIRFTSVAFSLDEEGPLSWELAPAERQRIEQAWRRRAGAEELALVRRFYAD
jgi:hypothetical protein